MFVLIHGANHSSRCWEPMIPYLNAPAISIDLPGRGARPAPLDKVHLSDFIESAVADIEAADVRDAVLVGHSMAGLSLPGIVDRVHERLRHIAFVSCSVPAQGASMVSELPEDLRELANRVGPDPAGALPGRKLTVQIMCDGMNEEQTAFTVAVRVPEAYWPMRDPVDLFGLRHAVPRTWVKLLADRAPTPEQADVFAERAGCTNIVELAAGHLAMITHPQQLAVVLNQLNSG